MCGIVGFVNVNSSGNADEMRSLCASMTDSLSHRGPDGSGIWVDEKAGIALGHRRLAIIDLTESGHQPMVSSSGRYVIILNGEIYNFRAIRAELESLACSFLGHSDTEVALSAIERWGFDAALSKFNGMFAFALWDRRDRILRLVRDRMGEKPLYYGWMGGSFIFASELKALREYPDFRVEVDRDSLELYLRYAYVPSPRSIYKGIHKLPPGTTLTLKEFTNRSIPKAVPYWSVESFTEGAVRHRFDGSESSAAEELNLLLKDSVRIRMESDVPLGVFLSGGIDSSLVSALMQAQATGPVKTFTIGFEEKAYNEAERAAKIAEHLGTEHTELYIGPGDSLNAIPKMPDIYDEPFADSSQIPTFLISKLTRQHVTVALSGDGGDELFGGYNRYFWGNFVWNRIRRIPRPLRTLGSKLLCGPSVESWDMFMKPLLSILPAGLRHKNFGYKAHKIAGILGAGTSESIYQALTSLWSDPYDVVKKNGQPPIMALNKKWCTEAYDFPELMMHMDMVTYLPDDIMVKVDRASMAVGLETRAAYLDHRVVEFALSIPLKMKIDRFKGKLLLRKVLDGYLPGKFFDSPKMGFAIPLDSWLRGPLRDWAESLLDEKKLDSDGFFEPRRIRAKWNEYLSGRGNWQYCVWAILMFQAWKERWL